MLQLFQLFRFVVNHPVNKNRRIAAFRDLLKWQLGSRLVPGEVVFNWIEGTKLIVTNGEAGLTGNVYSGLHEFEDMGFLLHFLRPEDNFFDIGSNRGSYTVLASGVCRASTIAFEPIPATFAKLWANVRINDLDRLVTPMNMGLGDRQCNLWFSDSLDAANHIVDVDSKIPKVSVPVVRLDDATNLVPALIKIDVEGFEMSVFSGATRILSNTELKGLIVEINESGAKYGHSDYDLICLLNEYGFRAYAYNPCLRELEESSAGSQCSGNTLFLRDLPYIENRIQTARRFGVRSIFV